MYDLIETGRGTPRTTSYATLLEEIKELTRRAWIERKVNVNKLLGAGRA